MFNRQIIAIHTWVRHRPTRAQRRLFTVALLPALLLYLAVSGVVTTALLTHAAWVTRG
jgi:hypothetical protein